MKSLLVERCFYFFFFDKKLFEISKNVHIKKVLKNFVVKFLYLLIKLIF